LTQAPDKWCATAANPASRKRGTGAGLDRGEDWGSADFFYRASFCLRGYIGQVLRVLVKNLVVASIID
jgi:hypothetical protein